MLREKVIVCLKGLKGPLQTHKNSFFPQNVWIFFFFNIHKKCVWYQFKVFHENMHIIKRKTFFTTRSSNCSVLVKFFPMLETPCFREVINPKTYKNHELDSKFFFLSSLAYKLVNLWVFEKNFITRSKNWIKKILVWDSTLPMNLKSVLDGN